MATNKEPKDGELQEMVDMDIDRVDAVTEPATRMKFLIVKSLSGEEGPSLEDLLDQARQGVTKAEDGGDGKSERDKLHEEAEARAKKYGIEFKEGKGHLTPPKGKPTDPEQYGDPVNYAYPIDEEHIRPAVAYFNHDGQREAGGYSEKEWEIIGKRIAAAANRYLGDGYKYEDGKIVTPNTQDDGKGETKKGDGGAAGAAEILDALAGDGASTVPPEHQPGSPAWEKVDVQLMQQAISGLFAVKELVSAIIDRERAEALTVDNDDWEHVWALQSVVDAITCALKELAGVTIIEQQEAQKGDDSVENGVTKAGRKMSKDSMEKVHQALTHIANAAGFKSVKDFHEACKAMGIATDDESREDEKKGDGLEDAEKGRVKEGGEKPDDTEKGKHPEDAEKGRKNGDGDGDGEGEGEDGKTRTEKSAAGESPAAEAVIKALEATGLTALAKSAGDLLKAADVIKSLEERVKALEEQPMPGGPMLRGAANIRQHDYYLVRKGESPDITDTNVLEQAIQHVESPYIRDVLSREAARRAHPLNRQNA